MNNKGQALWIEIIGIAALIGILALGAFAVIRPILHPGDQMKANQINNFDDHPFALLSIGGCARIPQPNEVKNVPKVTNTTAK